MMATSFHGIPFTLYLQCIQILNIFANEPDFERLMGNSESAQWPLQAGYPGMTIENLNEYVSIFSHCLVNIQNYHGIEIIGIKSPVYITRFDEANLERCRGPSYSDGSKEVYRFFFGKIPPKSEQNCTIEYDEILKYSDKSFTSRWYCTAHFDLFFPEPVDAPHIVYHYDVKGFELRSLFDVSYEYTRIPPPMDSWSKILQIQMQPKTFSGIIYLK